MEQNKEILVKKKDIQAELYWLNKKFELNALVESAKERQIERGEVYNCYFGIGVGSEMQKHRPCVILQNNDSNFNSGNTIVAPITHDNDVMDCLIPISKQLDNKGNSILDGQVNISNMMCISKARLDKKITSLKPSEMKAINRSLTEHLHLVEYINLLKDKIAKKDLFIDKIKKQKEVNDKYILNLIKISGCKSKKDLEELLTETKK